MQTKPMKLNWLYCFKNNRNIYTNTNLDNSPRSLLSSYELLRIFILIYLLILSAMPKLDKDVHLHKFIIKSFTFSKLWSPKKLACENKSINCKSIMLS